MNDINQLRNKMDEITLEMIRLLNERTQIAKEIGEVKKSLGRGITDEGREDALRNKILQTCKEINLDSTIATKFLNFLLNESVKVQSANKQTHLSIFLKAKEMEKAGEKIIHMEVGEPDFFPPEIVKKSLTEVYDKGFLKYGESKGLYQLREKLADYVSKRYNTKVLPQNIIISPGARFAVFSAITTLLNPGDEIIVIEPAWPAYKDCALYAGVKIRTVETSLEDKWEPSMNQISKAINQNTKMIVLNYPNNPTGKILSSKTQDQIIEIVKKNDLYILSDEIYSDYSYTEWKSILSYNYKKSIVTQSFSKSHAMTGFRIGYAIADESIIDKMSKVHALCLTNVSEPTQYIAMKAIDADVSKNSKIIKDRLDIITKKANEIGLDFIAPDGAMYLFARVNKEGFDGVSFATKMLEKGLAIAPGEGFGNYRNCIRISACQDEEVLKKGMHILQEVLNNNNG